MGVPHVSLDELAVSILPGKSPSRLAHWNATWWSHLQGNSSLLRPGGHDRDGGILRAYCTNLGPVAFVQVKGLRRGAPGRIRTCATASGGRCSIP